MVVAGFMLYIYFFYSTCWCQYSLECDRFRSTDR